jgi:3-methyladenine DNA glycosylase AlkC
MTERLKDLFFTDDFISELGASIKEFSPGFDKPAFRQQVYSDDWESKELKEKMHHITHCLGDALPEDYPTALNILRDVAPRFGGFDAMIFPDFVEKYGLDHWDLSFQALELFTGLCSSEFAIRPFLAKDPERGMKHMNDWAQSDNFHVRRLASEGCRPRLPWAMALNVFKKDPGLVLQLLEKLKDDPEEYVRKSVANNLNDISKDHPGKVMDVCERWSGNSKNTDWIVKRACRTLLKEGNTRALLLFGFGDPDQILVEDLSFDRPSLKVGEELHFSFVLELKAKGAHKVRLEYGVDFVKAGGKVSRKIFQIREAKYQTGKHTIKRKQSFKDLSTRKHYPGTHQLVILVNSIEKAAASIDLLRPDT